MERAAGKNEATVLQRLHLARIAMLVQAVALLVVIGQQAPGYLDQLLHPMNCTSVGLCIDLRGLGFEFAAVFLGPLALLLVATAALWRRPRKWPAALPLAIDLVLIGVVIYDAYLVAHGGYDEEPPILVQLIFGLIPAAVSLALTLQVLRRSPSALPPNPANLLL